MDPSVALHFWDSAMDSVLPRPMDTVFFSDQLLRGNAGQVSVGGGAGWRACGWLWAGGWVNERSKQAGVGERVGGGRWGGEGAREWADRRAGRWVGELGGWRVSGEGRGLKLKTGAQVTVDSSGQF